MLSHQPPPWLFWNVYEWRLYRRSTIVSGEIIPNGKEPRTETICKSMGQFGKKDQTSKDLHSQPSFSCKVINSVSEEVNGCPWISGMRIKHKLFSSKETALFCYGQWSALVFWSLGLEKIAGTCYICLKVFHSSVDN